MFTRKLILALCLAAGGALPLQAQTQTAQPPSPQTPQPPAAVASIPAQGPAVSASAVDGGQPKWIRPETAEQRKLRLGTIEDPGPDPDPKKRWERYGHSYFIERADRRWATVGGRTSTTRRRKGGYGPSASSTSTASSIR